MAERPEAVRALCKPGAILVFCMEAEAFAVLRTPSLEAADDIWVKPFHRDFGAVRFKKILAGIKHRKDSRLTQTYLDTIIDSIPDLIWFKGCKRVAPEGSTTVFAMPVGRRRRTYKDAATITYGI